MAKKILVTGGAGFIGSHLAKFHCEKGNEVWVVDNLQSGQISNIQELIDQKKIKFDQADIRTWNHLIEAVKWADCIYHMAAHVGQMLVLSNPIETLNNNIQSFEAILNAMVQAESSARILLASTSEIYGHFQEEHSGGVDEDTMPQINLSNNLQATYPLSKAVNELSLLSYAHSKGIHGVIARIFNTIGTHQSPAYGFVIPRLINQARNKLPLTVYGDGLQMRSFCDVRDTVNLLTLLLECDHAKGGIFNVGNDKECTILYLAELIKEIIGSTSPITFLSYEEVYGAGFVDIRRRRPSLKKLNEVLGVLPQYTLNASIQHILEG